METNKLIKKVETDKNKIEDLAEKTATELFDMLAFLFGEDLEIGYAVYQQNFNRSFNLALAKKYSKKQYREYR